MREIKARFGCIYYVFIKYKYKSCKRLVRLLTGTGHLYELHEPNLPFGKCAQCKGTLPSRLHICITRDKTFVCLTIVFIRSRYAPSADVWPLGDTSATLRIPRELRHLSIGIGAVLSTRGKFTKNLLFEN